MGFGNLFKKKQLTPKLQKAYDTELAKEKKQIGQRKNEAAMDRVKERARRDASNASSSRGMRIASGFAKEAVRAGESISKKIDKFDNEGFESFVTGNKKVVKRSTKPSGHAG